MPTDRREEILAFLDGYLSEVPGVSERCYRNRPGLDGVQRPAFVTLDADEQVVGEMDVRPSGRGDPGPRPLIVELSPEIYHAMRTLPAARHEDVGPAMSAIRFATLSALWVNWKSTELAGLLGPNGGVIYRGYTTDLKNGSLALGVQQFFFSFRYVLDPSHFA